MQLIKWVLPTLLLFWSQKILVASDLNCGFFVENFTTTFYIQGCPKIDNASALITQKNLQIELESKGRYGDTCHFETKKSIRPGSYFVEYNHERICKIQYEKLDLGIVEQIKTVPQKVYPDQIFKISVLNLDMSDIEPLKKEHFSVVIMKEFKRDSHIKKIEKGDGSLYSSPEKTNYQHFGPKVNITSNPFPNLGKLDIDASFSVPAIPRSYDSDISNSGQYRLLIFYKNHLIVKSSEENSVTLMEKGDPWITITVVVFSILFIFLMSLFFVQKSFLIEADLNAYSLSKFQVCVWTVIVSVSYFFIVFCTLYLGMPTPALNPSLAALLGLGVGSFGLPRIFHKTKTKIRSQKLALREILMNNGNYDITRLQLVIFNCIALVIFLFKFYENISSHIYLLPEIPSDLLAILAGSNAGYFGGKFFPEQISVNRIMKKEQGGKIVYTAIGSGLTAKTLINMNHIHCEIIGETDGYEITFSPKGKLTEPLVFEFTPLEGNSLILQNIEIIDMISQIKVAKIDYSQKDGILSFTAFGTRFNEIEKITVNGNYASLVKPEGENTVRFQVADIAPATAFDFLFVPLKGNSLELNKFSARELLAETESPLSKSKKKTLR